MKQNTEKRRKVNSGSALITVVVFMTFITILATLLMYVTAMNFQIKQTDYRNKKSFYSGETALEEIRQGLMVDISDAAVEAYKSTMMHHSAGDLGAGFEQSSEDRGANIQSYYHSEFVKNLEEIWLGDGGSKIGKVQAAGGTWAAFLTSYRTDGILEIRDPADPGNTSFNPLDDDIDNDGTPDYDAGYVILRGLKLTYTNEDGFTTIISTDLYIEAPQIDWTVVMSKDALETVPSPLPGGTPVTLDAKTASGVELVDLSECVDYYNWTKQ